MRRFFLAAATIAAVAACSDTRTEAVARITPEEAKELRIDASQLYKDLQEKRLTSQYLPLKPAVWPERFKKYKPLRVGLYRDGLALALEGSTSNEQGIHVTPIAMDLEPTRGRIEYEKIQDGVYWYRLGK